MLDGDYRRALGEIEARLEAEDPALAARLRGPRFPTGWALAAGLYITLPVVALLFGPRTALVTHGSAAMIIFAVWCGRRA
jgi:DUF3040 family protein